LPGHLPFVHAGKRFAYVEEIHMRQCAPAALSVLGIAALLAACDGEAQPTHAKLLTGVSPAHCVAALEGGTTVDPLRCPGALRLAVAEAATTCREAGGKIRGVDDGVVWAMDVNGDGRDELAFDLEENVGCQDAFSVFSCGSLGCPKGLYELRAGTWTTIASLSTSMPEQIELGARGANGYRTLTLCGLDECAERLTYEWQGSSYESTRLEVRGVGVDFAGSIHGLYPLLAATTVLAAPSAGARDVGQYDAGIEVAIIGTAERADYYYVSPCNACESGFVPKSAVDVR
jgi:hypothetical protein